MPPPQTNATLKSVAGETSADTWRGGATAGAEEHLGDVRCYFAERRDKASGDSADRVSLRWLIVANSDLAPDVLSAGDVVVWRRDNRAEDDSGTVMTVERRELPGMPADLQTTRLTFEPE